MEGDQEPFPLMFFVNEAFHQTNTLESSVTEEEIEQKYSYQSGDFRLQNLTQGVKPEGCEPGNSWCGHSNEDGVELQNENNERDYKLIKDSNQIKCESEITQLDTDSLVSNDAVNIEMKVESIEEECFVTDNYNPIKYEREITQVDTDSLVSNDEVNIEMNVGSIQEESFGTDNSDEIKVEIDVCDDFESNVLYPMESEKEHNQASSNDCNKIKVERDEEGDVSFSSTSHTPNTDGNQVIHYDVSTRLYSNKQEKLKECTVLLGPRVDEISKHSLDDSEINNVPTSTMTFSKGASAKKSQRSIKQCHVCLKVFTHSGNLKKRLLIHTGDKPHKCTVCDKAFTDISNLKTHLLTHTGDKHHKCTICDKAFAHRVSLKTHLLIHTGDKPHKCTVCDKAFAHRVSLNTHLLIHTGDKPNQCTDCGKAFTWISQLKTHLLTHTGDKAHKCTVCGKAFTWISALKTHLLIHTGDKAHKCTVCGKAFTWISALKTHWG